MTQSAQRSQVQDLSAAFARLVDIAAPGIVAVKSAHSRSSGFFWRPGLIVTADEALSEEGDFTKTLPSGESLVAWLVGRDHTTDIAVFPQPTCPVSFVFSNSWTRVFGPSQMRVQKVRTRIEGSTFTWNIPGG
jgi:hypothetical protein